MIAGRGIVHSEMPVKTESRVHGLQLWINLPKEHKIAEPQYQELLDGQIPRTTPEEGVTLKVIAGESPGVKSQVYTRTSTMYLDFKMDKNKTVTQTIPSTFTGFIYMLKAWPTSVTRSMRARPTTPSHSPKMVPIQSRSRPIVQHGQFVTNSKKEIYDTFVDYQFNQNDFERARNWRSTIA